MLIAPMDSSLIEVRTGMLPPVPIVPGTGIWTTAGW